MAYRILLPALLLLTNLTTAQWSNDPTPICIVEDDQDLPKITSDSYSGAIIAWQDDRNGNHDIFAQRINAEGLIQWTINGTPVCADSSEQGIIDIVSDGDGGAILIWFDHRGITSVYAQKLLPGGLANWMVNGVNISGNTSVGGGGITNRSWIICDGKGGAIITWHTGAGGGFDIYAQRIDFNGMIKWQPNGVAISSSLGEQQEPAIINDGLGGAIIAWQDKRNGNSDIFVQRIDSNGVVNWTVDGVALCVNIGHQNFPKIISDGNGGAIIAWNDFRSGYSDIYIQRINSNGVIQWMIDGVGICTKNGYQFLEDITTDGNGGAIIVWEDVESSPDRIYAQKINNSGIIQWTPNGVVICDSDGWTQRDARIVPDGSGGAVIAWEEERAPGQGIYAQRINATGNVQWVDSGSVITHNLQFYSDNLGIIGTEDGKYIITWEILNSNLNFDIYCSRLESNGTLPVETDDPIASKFELFYNYPNPFNPSTKIKYSIPNSSNVIIKVFDVLGNEIATLVSEEKSIGSYEVEFDASSLPSGIYFYRLQAGSFVETKKMVLMK